MDTKEERAAKRADNTYRRRNKLCRLLMKQAKTTAANFMVNNPNLTNGHYVYLRELRDDLERVNRNVENAIDLAIEHIDLVIIENAMMRKKLIELDVDMDAFLEEVEELCDQENRIEP
jgi:hypothetical protein